MLFLQVHTDRELGCFRKVVYPPIPSPEKISNTPWPLPFSGHPIQILNIFQTIPPPPLLSGRQNFPLWVRYESFLEQPNSMINY